ncbi:MAG: hypothetical protein M1827_005105 [Pycnora praestabilis]|nr:MAG: hypothetical protein M1827_005105 [Pycnora praestabilis]
MESSMISEPPECEMSHTSSRTWQSPDEIEFQRFLVIRTHLSRMTPYSDAVPWLWADWLQHRIEMLDARKEEVEYRMKCMRAGAGNPLVRPPFQGKLLRDGHATVLSGHKTMWSPLPTMGRLMAPWPGMQEMKWEGDERAATGQGRFPPLPREAGNGTVVWHHLRWMKPLPFDEVRRLADLGEDEMPLEETMTIKNDIPMLINRDLWNAIND